MLDRKTDPFHKKALPYGNGRAGVFWDNSVQVFDVNVSLLPETGGIEIIHMVLHRAGIGYGLVAAFGEHGEQIFADGEIAVLGDRVIQDQFQILSFIFAEGDADRLSVAADEVGAVHDVGIQRRAGEGGADIIPVLAEQVAEIAVVRADRSQVIDFFRLAHLPQEIEVDGDEAEIHDRSRIGMNDQGVDGEDDAADRVDDPQFDDGCEKKRDQDQSGAKVAEHLDQCFRIHTIHSFI